MSVRARTAVALGVVLVACAGVWFTVARAGSDEPSHCVRNTAEARTRGGIVTGTGPRVVVIGDSYSAGWGLPQPSASWPGQLAGEVHVDAFSGSGFSAGASACSGVAYADRAARAVRGGADLVVVQGGLNDADQSTAAIRRGVRLLLDRLPGLPVVLVGPPAAPWAGAHAQRVDAILAEEAARGGVRHVSMLALDLDYLDDDLHLTPAGHAAFGRAVAAALAG